MRRWLDKIAAGIAFVIIWLAIHGDPFGGPNIVDQYLEDQRRDEDA